jgi:hypothetical protein
MASTGLMVSSGRAFKSISTPTTFAGKGLGSLAASRVGMTRESRIRLLSSFLEITVEVVADVEVNRVLRVEVDGVVNGAPGLLALPAPNQTHR